MPGLFGQLHLGLSALQGQQFGLEVTGENIANVATPGFSRRRLTLSAARPLSLPPVGQLGTGLDAGPVTAARSRFLEARLQQETAGALHDETRGDVLNRVSSVLSEADGVGFGDELSAVFNAFSELAARPESLVLRDQVLSRSETLIRRMQTAYRELQATSSSIDQELGSEVDEVNRLLTRIAELNGRVASSERVGVPANAERDERGQLLLKLNELIGVASYENPDGQVSVTLAAGEPLVIGDRFMLLQAAASGPAGQVRLFHQTVDVTARLSGGSIGGRIEARDTDIPAYLLRIDTLADTLIREVNTLHQAGFDLAGGTGNAFFTPYAAGPSGATLALSLAAAVAGNPAAIAASAPPTFAAGDGRQAQAISDLRNQTVLAGGTQTFGDYYASLVHAVGSDARDATTSAQASRAVALQLERDSLAVSAVSLDEEAVNLVKYQRAYEASARFIRVIDELTDLVVNGIR